MFCSPPLLPRKGRQKTNKISNALLLGGDLNTPVSTTASGESTVICSDFVTRCRDSKQGRIRRNHTQIWSNVVCR